MKMRLIRERTIHETTLGVLFVNNVFQCFTLEDAIREVPGQPVATWKVYGETAIKAGSYKVALTLSNRFGQVTPELLNVDGFTAIRMHWGNKRQDSLGCILVGRARGDAQIFESRLAFEALMGQLTEAAKGTLELHIENPVNEKP